MARPRCVVAATLAALPLAALLVGVPASATAGSAPHAAGPRLEAERVTANAPAAVTTQIGLDGMSAGRTFDGVGAISGGGGNSRLLIDYPATQRNEILDYLFKPGYGASLQVLKVEIGGDANSTDGSEPSVEHARGVVNCNAGYEFWLAEQAKLRNPNVKLYGLAWTAPGWIGNGNFWSQDTIDYLMTWLDCAHTHGLTMDYLGGWNERDYDKAWYESLHATLAARHYPAKVVGADSDWRVADDMVKDADFAKSVDIVGAHYTCEGGDGGNANSCSTTQHALDTGKPLWNSEGGSQDLDSGTPPLIRSITRGYIDAKTTAMLNWPLLAAITPNLPYPTVGLMVAAQPWSGNYGIGKSLWATGHITQFTQPGWRFLDGASGYLGNDRTSGSYVTLRSPSSGDYSTIVETTTAGTPSQATFSVTGGLSTGPVHVWATNLNSDAGTDHFVHLPDLTPDKAGSYSLTLDPGHIYTLSTTTGAGKGHAKSPAAHPLALPYRDNFDKYRQGQEARYVSDMQGSFEIAPCAAGRRGNCLQQMAATKPIEWQQDSEPFTLLGDPSWKNYTVRVDAELTKPGMIELIGRAGTQSRPQSHQQGYYFQISDTGAWTIFKSDVNGNHTALARASTDALGTNRWHQLSLAFSGATITAAVDGHDIAVVADGSYAAGQIGLGFTNYDTDQFDNLSITPTGSSQPPATLSVVPSAATLQRGDAFTVSTRFTVPQHAATTEGVNITVAAPAGFVFDPQPQVFGAVKPGQTIVATWAMTAPTDRASTATISATATYAQHGVAHWLRGTGQIEVTNPPPPAGVNDVSNLPFLSATNGWGPVERDMSVGGNNAGDGQPITLHGTAYPKGLGTNSISDVKIFLGGNCSTFTSTVGIDDETRGSGSVTFSVIGDGRTLAATPVMRAGDAARTINVDVSGVQDLDIVVGDAGDGNAWDHGDWAAPTLTCARS